MKLSIIIPVYNGEKFIERCLTSVLQSKWDEFEVIVVNDGSGDRTKEIVESIVNIDDRLTLISVTNGGVSRARNTGLSLAKGQYVMFLDADDYLVENWAETCVAVTNTQFDVCFFDYFTCNENEDIHSVKVYDKKNINKGEVLKNYLYKDVLNCPWAKIFARDLLENYRIEFPQDIKIGEDAIFVGKVLDVANSFLYSPVEILNYYINAQSASFSKNNKFSDRIALFEAKARMFFKYQGVFSLDKKIFSDKNIGDLISTLRERAFYVDRNMFCSECEEYQSGFEKINLKIHIDKKTNFYVKIKADLVMSKQWFFLYALFSMEKLLLKYKDGITHEDK